MCVDFNVGPCPSGYEERRLKRQEILALLKKIPLNYSTVTAKNIPKNFLRKESLAEYRKVLLAIVNSSSLRMFVNVLETGYLTEELCGYSLYLWLVSVDYHANKDGENMKDFYKEAFANVKMAEQWFLSARKVIENDLSYRMLEEGDAMAKEVLIRRFGSDWSEKMHIAQFNAEQARKLAEIAKGSGESGTPVEINFRMG